MPDILTLIILGILSLLIVTLFIMILVLRNNMKRLEERQKSELILSTLSIGGIRYDAFQDVSGKLSFSLAFMAGEKGIILTSIHTREQSYLYLKPYDKDKTSLTEEEKKAVEIALKDGYTIKDT
jgi:predicted DNA binding protein